MDLSMKIEGGSNFAPEASEAYNLEVIAKANSTPESIFAYLASLASVKSASEVGPHLYLYGGREGLLEMLEKANAFLPKMNGSSLGEMNECRFGENFWMLTILVKVARVYHLDAWLKRYNEIFDKIMR